MHEATYEWWTPEEVDLHRSVNAFADELAERNLEAMWSHEVPRDVIAELGRRGLYGAVIPREYGGLSDDRDGDATRLSIIMEALGRVPAATMAFGVGCAHHIATYGTAEQKQRWLPGLAEASVLGAVAVTEPYAGSDAAAIETSATREPDGGYRLVGRKRYITHTGLADVYLVYVATSRDPDLVRARRHLSAFLVPADSPRLHVERINELGGSQYLRNGVLHMAGVVLPEDARLAEEGDGWRIMTGGLNLERVAVAAKCLGMLDEALMTAWRWLRRRRQFGSSLDRIPTIRGHLGTALAEGLAIRAMTYHSARLVDRRPDDAGLEAASSKMLAAQVALRGASTALELMGADGYSRNYPVFQIVQDLRLYQVGAGSNEVMRTLVYRLGEKRYADALERLPAALIPPTMTPADPGGATGELRDVLLGVLAEHYRMHSGLHLTIADLAAALGHVASVEAIAKEIWRLSDEGLVDAVGRGDQLTAARATYEGLDRAADLSFYRLIPSWAADVPASVEAPAASGAAAPD